MYSSSYYKDKINKYTNVKNQLQNTTTYFESTEEVLTSVSQKLEEIILGTKVVNTEIIKTELANLTNLHNAINEAISECNQKITENNLLYNRALGIESKHNERALEVENNGN